MLRSEYRRKYPAVKWCHKCGPVNKWHEHHPLSEDDPQFEVKK